MPPTRMIKEGRHDLCQRHVRQTFMPTKGVQEDVDLVVAVAGEDDLLRIIGCPRIRDPTTAVLPRRIRWLTASIGPLEPRTVHRLPREVHRMAAPRR